MQIPENAKKVFEGIIFDTYQWKQKQFDGSVQTFEMLTRPNTVQILPIVGDKILVVQEEQPNDGREFFGLVGGQENKGEQSLTAAIREMKEEVGYTSETWELWKTKNLYTRIDWTVSTFIARNCKKTLEPHLDPGEKITPLLVSFDEFMEIITDPGFRSKDLTLDILILQYQNKLDEFKKMLFS